MHVIMFHVVLFLFFAFIWTFIAKFCLSRIFRILFLMFQRFAIFRMISKWCHVNCSVTVVLINLIIVTGMTSRSRSILSACRAVGQQRSRCPSIDPELNSDFREHLRKTVAQNYWLSWKLLISIVKMLDYFSLWKLLFELFIAVISGFTC